MFPQSPLVPIFLAIHALSSAVIELPRIPAFYPKMSASYETEQKELEARIAELKSQLATEKDIALNTKHFLDLVRRYTDIQELDAEIIREFVEKIIIHKAECVDGQELQKIKIIWNCIGEFQTPTSYQ